MASTTPSLTNLSFTQLCMQQSRQVQFDMTLNRHPAASDGCCCLASDGCCCLDTYGLDRSLKHSYAAIIRVGCLQMCTDRSTHQLPAHLICTHCTTGKQPCPGGCSPRSRSRRNGSRPQQ
jgi:hypothetical protein